MSCTSDCVYWCLGAANFNYKSEIDEARRKKKNSTPYCSLGLKVPVVYGLKVCVSQVHMLNPQAYADRDLGRYLGNKGRV